jgi:hypothetical protein
LAHAERKGASGKAVEIAKNLLAEGMGVDAISRATDLTVDEILRL